MKRCRAMLMAAVVAIACSGSGSAAAENFDVQIKKYANQLRGKPEVAAAGMDGLLSIAANDQIPREHRLAAAHRWLDVDAGLRTPAAREALVPELHLLLGPDTPLSTSEATLLLKQGQELRRMGRQVDALQAYQLLLDRATGPDQRDLRIDAFLGVARAMAAEGDYETAMKFVNKATMVAEEPARRWASYAVGIRVALDGGLAESAEQLIRKSCLELPTYASSAAGRASVARMLEARDYDGVLKWAPLLLCMPQGSPTATEIHRDYILALLHLERNEQALQEAKRHYTLVDLTGTDKAIDVLIRTLEAVDGELMSRVEVALDFQQFGPAGPDGTSGTADDLLDPMEVVVVPAWEEADALIETMVRALPARSAALRGRLRRVQGRPLEALAEYRRAYGMAGFRSLDAMAEQIACCFRGMDGHILRANRYLQFQRGGPEGKDGVIGTDDDLVDPQTEITLPSTPDWLAERVEGEIAMVDTGYRGVRETAYLRIGAGQFDEALVLMRQAYRERPIALSHLRGAITDVATALRAQDGHVFRANQYINFMKYGPSGADGELGTPDDLTNPLKDIDAN